MRTRDLQRAERIAADYMAWLSDHQFSGVHANVINEIDTRKIEFFQAINATNSLFNFYEPASTVYGQAGYLVAIMMEPDS